MFAPGDAAILQALYCFMFMQTWMLSKLLARHKGSILRRMRWLVSNGFVVSLERPMVDNTYTLGKRGWRYIAEMLQTRPEKLPYSKESRRIAGQFLQHSLQMVRFWLELDLATRTHDAVAMFRAIPEWTLDEPSAKDVTKRFLLWEKYKRVENDVEREFSFRPDAAFLLYNRSVGPEKLAAMFLELDRGTEAQNIIRNKMMGFKLAFEQGIYRKYDAQLMRVLFVVDGGVRRIRNMQHQLQLLATSLGDAKPADPTKAIPSPASFVYLFRFARIQDITEKTIIDSPVWFGWKGDDKYALFSPSQSKQERANA